MTTQQVYSVCGMCTVRCPIMAEVKNGEVQFLQGNPHIPAMKAVSYTHLTLPTTPYV